MSEFLVQQVPAPEERFTIVSNDLLRGRLPTPLRALERVLLLHLISLSSGWRMSRQQLDRSVTEGREAVSSALRGLEQKGYLRRDRKRDSRGTWRWTWSVTRDPIGSPLPSPSPENPSMDATSGNTTSPQVAPSTENPSPDSRGIDTEDQPKKTTKKTGKDQKSAPPVGARAGARAGLKGKDLVGEDPKTLTRRLTAVWCSVVTECGGALPVLDGGGWDYDGTPHGREQHPAGRRIRAWVENYPHPSAEELDVALEEIRAHARRWAEQHHNRDLEVA
ncbi:hypothetical protein [Saccharothrix variisporea]|uniref:Helix-turn-helix protein n=1 Tax=Saccharothrix variisporea TaxID=543527 RepID=A0A495WZL7_9PSEU|nr:hypothetical protein [Saccharothrix variisporea]RKT67087.1 hypothetical protein DFJ66_0255 [Saccharothrix variisporea]